MSDPPDSSIRLSYVICTTPRSGSNLLCEVLQSTGVAGRPDEYFWHPPLWREHWDRPRLEAYLRDVRQKGTTPNGIFGVKLMWTYLDDLLPRLAEVADIPDADPLSVLTATFPNLHYVWLTRRDKVRQGISWYRALKSNVWRSTDPNTSQEAEIPFSYPEIESLVEQAVRSDRSWLTYFQRYAIDPLTFTYEDVAAAPEESVHTILRHLSLPPPLSPWPPSWQHQQQADARTDAWVRQYQQYQMEQANRRVS
jgi:trehalose 2-sulfotransferase